MNPALGISWAETGLAWAITCTDASGGKAVLAENVRGEYGLKACVLLSEMDSEFRTFNTA
jgi:hypothetical protein